MNKDKIYFTSDTHFSHANIIKYTNRPFNSADDMDSVMIERWNAKIPKDGFVFHLGDFAFCRPERALEILDQLNGKIHLIRGNHDKRLLKDKRVYDRFVWVWDYYMLKVPDAEMDNVQKVVLFHYPIEEWDCKYHGSWHLYGHCHMDKELDVGMARLHVGVDTNLFTPLSYNDVKTIMTKSALQKLWEK